MRMSGAWLRRLGFERGDRIEIVATQSCRHISCCSRATWSFDVSGIVAPAASCRDSGTRRLAGVT
jgi:hypothetical protein